jgi:hypothetical protein
VFHYHLSAAAFFIEKSRNRLLELKNAVLQGFSLKNRKSLSQNRAR